MLRKALELREALHGVESLQVAEASFLLARLYLSKASLLQVTAAKREASEYLDQAEKLLDMAFETRERLSGPKSVGVGDVLQELTVLCLQRHSFAETACPENFERRKRITGIVTGNLPPTHPDWTKALYALADSQEARGAFDQSLVLRQAVLEQMRKSFGDTSPRVAQSLTLIADTYRKMHFLGAGKSRIGRSGFHP